MDAEQAFGRIQQMPGDLRDAMNSFNAERQRIASEYGAAASIAPAVRTLTANVAALDAEMASVQPSSSWYAENVARSGRLNASRQTEYGAFQVALAANAALLPFLDDAALIARLAQAVDDGRVADTAALLEISNIRIPKPTADLQALQVRAFELSAPTQVQQTWNYVAAVNTAVSDYEALRAEAATLLAPPKTAPLTEAA